MGLALDRNLGQAQASPKLPIEALVHDVIELKASYGLAHAAGLVLVLENRITPEPTRLVGEPIRVVTLDDRVLQSSIEDAKDHEVATSVFLPGLVRADVQVGSRVVVGRSRATPADSGGRQAEIEGTPMAQSRLPEELEEVTVSSLLDGETAFVVPWAIVADEEGHLWIRGDYRFTHEPHGTSHVEISRQGDSISVAKQTIGDHRYRRSPSLPGNSLIPVVLQE